MTQRSVRSAGRLVAALLLGACLSACAVTGDFGNYQAGQPALFVVEQNDERNSVRLLDIPIFTLFEYTRDKEARTVQVGFLESPLFKIFARRDEGRRSELRFVDLRLIALFRRTRDGAVRKTHVVKLPFIGSLYGFETDGERQKRNVLFVSREGPVPPPEPEPEPEPPPVPEPEPEPEPAPTASVPDAPSETEVEPKPEFDAPETPGTPQMPQTEEAPTEEAPSDAGGSET